MRGRGDQKRKLKTARPKLSARPRACKIRGAGSAALRKNRTSAIRRRGRSIRDVAYADRREFVAEARPWCGSGDLPQGTWALPLAQQTHLLDKGVDRKSTRLNSSHTVISYA